MSDQRWAGWGRAACGPRLTAVLSGIIAPVRPRKIAERIEVDPHICHGKPRFAGTRVPVHMVLGLLASGLPPEEIIRDYYDHLSRRRTSSRSMRFRWR
ncbi:MAG: DUF433 domain-containing protein [Candidatus Bipolaricaulota bacterium]|nr:DUF433 domain-containing protein [Candidatus Bipolaricaulota bacterium]